MQSPLNIRYTDALALLVGSWLAFKLWKRSRAGAQTTKLPGPPSKSWLFGVTKEVNDSDDGGVIFEDWAKEYGDVFQIPGPFGQRRTVLLDPKSLTYVLSKTEFTFLKSKFVKQFIENIVRLS